VFVNFKIFSKPCDASTINEKTIADFTCVVEQTGILTRDAIAPRPDAPTDTA